MAGHITHDPIYDTVAPDDFPAMLDVERYGQRTSAFDAIISGTHDHYWDPLDSRYVDFAQPFDLDREYLVPPETIPELRTAVADRLDEGQRIRLVNENVHWSMSTVLHGEQGGLSLSASLCHLLRDPAAQEYAAMQAHEEARHVTAFSRYIQTRWGKPYRVGDGMGALLLELVTTTEVYKKLVGMQLLIEGLAMGAFGHYHANARDPVLRRLTQLVMTDEAYHHKFGKIWAERTVPKMTTEEHARVEDWAAECFQTLLYNLVNIRQKQDIYAQFGLDWEWVRGACREVFTEEDRRAQLGETTNMFRVLVKTLLNAGIITDRTYPIYSAWVDIKQLREEGDNFIGHDIADEGLEYLRGINKDRKIVGQRPPADRRRAAGR